MYPSTTLLSDHYVSRKQSIFNSFLKIFATFTDSIAAISSRRGINTNFLGVTLSLLAMCPFIHIYHSEIADLAIYLFIRIWKMMQPKLLYLSKSTWFKYLLILWLSKSFKLFCHISHSLIMESPTLSSQPFSSWQSSWSSLSPFKIKGATNPSGS